MSEPKQCEVCRSFFDAPSRYHLGELNCPKCSHAYLTDKTIGEIEKETKKPASVTIYLRVDPLLGRQVCKLAKKQNVSINKLVTGIIEEHLERKSK